MISIITPCKNAERWLIDCYQSIKSQTRTDWEWIIVDDASTDTSWQIIQSLKARDARVKPFKNKGSGIIQALNTGMEVVKGSMITRMDADDIMPQNRLKLMAERLEMSPKRTVVTGLVKYFSEETISDGYQQYESWINQINLEGTQWPSIYRECVIASPNWMVNTSELKAIGGFQGLEYPEDYDLVFRWYTHQFSIEVIPEVTLYWREHADRTSRNSDHYQQEAFFELKLKSFKELDYRGGPLVVWGDNVKSKLAMRLLKDMGLAPIQLDLNDYRRIEAIKSPLLLIAVFPDDPQRKQIVVYLKELGMVIGQDWWWL